MTFRESVLEEAAQIAEINNDYLAMDPESGFLISPLDLQSVRRQIRSGLSKIFVASSSGCDVAGFVEVTSSAESSVLDQLSWEDAVAKKQFQHGPTSYIKKVAVRPACRHRHVGRFLYERLFERYSNRHFYAFVVKNPVTNRASLAFHTAMGFRRAAVFRAARFQGLDDYQSTLFFRPAP